MDKKTALVTGANKGIGFATVKLLAEKGFKVWLGARDRARGQSAVDKLRKEGLDVTFLTIDVSDDRSVNDAAIQMERETGILDVLINNAGIGIDLGVPPSRELIQNIRAQYEVNTFGPIRTTQAFLPLLKASPKANILMLSSIVGSIGLSSDPDIIYGQVNFGGYSSSKAALNALTVSFAKELAEFRISVNALEPGHIKTDLNNNTGDESPETAAKLILQYALQENLAPTGGFFGPDGTLPW